MHPQSNRDNPCPVPVMILAGGRGTRLGKLCNSCPKPLLPVQGKPFVEHIVRFLHHVGVCEILFLVGYLGERFEQHFEGISLDGTSIGYFREESPLGTGGAVAAAVAARPSGDDRPFIVLNGDSFAPFSPVLLAQRADGVDGALLSVTVPDARRYGSLDLDPSSGELRGFREKTQSPAATPGAINAGVYCLSPSLFTQSDTEQGMVSLETYLFPRWLNGRRRFRVLQTDGPFLDIGTPQSLTEADSFAALTDYGIKTG